MYDKNLFRFNEPVKIGIDVGNYDCKSRHTSTPSSYTSSGMENRMGDSCIYYNGVYYSPSDKRNNQQMDKTKDGYCLIISTFAIAKELLFKIRQTEPRIKNEEVQEVLREIKEIRIGVGLPAGILTSQAEPLKKCYMDAWKNGVEFLYKENGTEFEFNFKLVDCTVFPQDYLAVAYNSELSTPKEYKDYNIIGIGGGTTDVIPVSEGNPRVEKCVSLEKGTTILYSECASKVQLETGKMMDNRIIESVLKGDHTVVDAKREEIIKNYAEAYTKKLVDEIIHLGVSLSDYPTVFIGGGSLLLRDYLESNPEFSKVEFVEDVCANAMFFEALA